MRFVKASERLPDENPDNGYVLTRRVIEGEMISGNLSTRIGFCQLMRKYDLANRDLSEYEWLDESTPAEDWVKVLQENLQAQIAGFYNHDKTPEEKKIRNAVIQEYKDLIAIFKHKFPSPPKK